MDPAYRDRFWQCDLTPSVEEWLEWARDSSPEGGNVHPAITNFIVGMPSVLDPSEAANPGDKQPSRRSWDGFNTAARLAGFLDKEWKELSSDDQTVMQMIATGFLGHEVAGGFIGFFKELERQVSAVDVIDNWDDVKKRVVEMTQSDHNGLIDRMVTWLKNPENLLTEKQAENVGKFVEVIPGELRVAFWQEVAKNHATTTTNLKTFHKYVAPHIIKAIGQVQKTTA